MCENDMGKRIVEAATKMRKTFFLLFFLLVFSPSQVESGKDDLQCSKNGICNSQCQLFCDTNFTDEDGICVHYETVSSSRESLILLAVLMSLIVVNQIIGSWKSYWKMFRRIWFCRTCETCRGEEDDSDNETAYGSNPESGTKTAAYTVASREFLATSSDPELEWALELSAQIASENFRRVSLSRSSRSSHSDRNSRRNRRVRDTSFRLRSPDSFSSNRSSSSNASSFRSFNSYGASTSTFSHSTTLTSSTGAIPRRWPISRKKAEVEKFSYNSVDEVIMNNIIRRHRQSSASSEDSLINSPSNSFSQNFRRVESLPSNLRRENKRNYVPLNNGDIISIASTHEDVTPPPPLI